MRGPGLVIVDWIAGKNARLRCATSEFTSLRLEHESFAVSCSFALLGSAFHPILVHRLAASLHASSPRSVALSQLRFASFVVINLREDLHLQECAHVGRTMKKGGLSRPNGTLAGHLGQPPQAQGCAYSRTPPSARPAAVWASTAAICTAANSSASCSEMARRSVSSISSFTLRAWW